MAEVAYLAQAVHWPLGTLLDLEHADRHRLIELTAPSSPDGHADGADTPDADTYTYTLAPDPRRL